MWESIEEKFVHPLEVCASLDMLFASLPYRHVPACRYMPHVVTSPGETGVECKRRPMWNSKTKRINFGRTTRRIQIWVQAGFQSLREWPVWFWKFKIPQKVARWNLETRKPTWTFLHVAAEVYAPMAYGEIPGSWVQEESYVTVENGKNEFWGERRVGFK